MWKDKRWNGSGTLILLRPRRREIAGKQDGPSVDFYVKNENSLLTSLKCHVIIFMPILLNFMKNLASTKEHLKQMGRHPHKTSRVITELVRENMASL